MSSRASSSRAQHPGERVPGVGHRWVRRPRPHPQMGPGHHLLGRKVLDDGRPVGLEQLGYRAEGLHDLRIDGVEGDVNQARREPAHCLVELRRASEHLLGLLAHERAPERRRHPAELPGHRGDPRWRPRTVPNASHPIVVPPATSGRPMSDAISACSGNARSDAASGGSLSRLARLTGSRLSGGPRPRTGSPRARRASAEGSPSGPTRVSSRDPPARCRVLVARPPTRHPVVRYALSSSSGGSAADRRMQRPPVAHGGEPLTTDPSGRSVSHELARTSTRERPWNASCDTPAGNNADTAHCGYGVVGAGAFDRRGVGGITFRLTVSEMPDLTTMRLAGRLGDAAVASLNDACAGARRPLVLDLSQVTGASDAAVLLLRRLTGAGVHLLGVSQYVALLLAAEKPPVTARPRPLRRQPQDPSRKVGQRGKASHS